MSSSARSRGGRLAWYWSRANAAQTPYAVEPRRTSAIPADEADAPVRLDQLVDKLVRIHGWLTLSSASGLSGASFPYELAFEDDKGQPVEATALTAGRSYRAVLRRAPGVSEPTAPRHVYLLNIDAFGNGSFLFPVSANSSANRCPRADREASCVLHEGGTSQRETTFTMCDPAVDGEACALGPEAFLLIVSQEPLTDVSALNWSGVVLERSKSSSVKCAGTLACLLQTTGTRTASPASSAPGDWSVQHVFAISGPAN
jgi:hypothetical protein